MLEGDHPSADQPSSPLTCYCHVQTLIFGPQPVCKAGHQELPVRELEATLLGDVHRAWQVEQGGHFVLGPII